MAGVFSFIAAALMVLIALFDKVTSTTSILAAWLFSLFGLGLGAYCEWYGPVALSGIMLTWSIAVLLYGLNLKGRFINEAELRGKGARELADSLQQSDSFQDFNNEDGGQSSEISNASCSLHKVSGDGKVASSKGKYADLFTYLYYVFSTSPSRAQLGLKAWAAAGAYKVLYIRWGEVELEPTIDLSCRQGTCKIGASKTGKKAGQNSVCRAQIEYTLTPVGDLELEIDVVMGAALEASGGPEFTVGKEGVAGLKLTWPDAKQSTTEEMGQYVWRCIKTGGNPGTQ